MGYKSLLILEKILMALPKSARKNFFVFLAFIGYISSKKYRNIVKQNLDYAFDNSMSEAEIKTITKYSFKNLLFNFMHLMELRHMTKKELADKVTVVNKEAVDRVHKEGRAVIYVTSHYCAWELGGASVGAFIEPTAAVYKKMKNSVYEEWLLDARSRFGNSNLEKTNVLKPLIRLIKNGKASGILIDTNINKREGVLVNFMGKPIRQTATPAYLARKFNAAIIPVTIRTDDEEHYTLMLFDEIKVPKTENEEDDIQKATQLQADWLTSIITKEPKFWFWLHRRWKSDNPQIYKK
ncbi:lipid A biosynthesis lauroyl acyltransferase [Sulfurimonas sp.]|uniref:lipid A biosynthesis lauroyl acyltransferase n=1 Tax=Sulfurimonas sp. TaxID=2022749 RepID=UPI00260490F7|nr:lipid A biosynthesis lauroyl acyltransferase [Sulfurimonas sp.]